MPARLALLVGVTSASVVCRRAAIGAAVAWAGRPAAPTAAYDDSQFKSVSTQVGGSDFTQLPSGLQFKDVRPGNGGDKAALGDTVAVQLSGRCLNLNGKKFISTQDPEALAMGLSLSEPFTFTLGAGKVIPGLEQAVLGMTKNGYRRVVIPQSLGYDVEMSLQPQPDNFQDLRSLESIVKNPNRAPPLLPPVRTPRSELAGSPLPSQATRPC